MTYTSPTLRIVGSAQTLVLGGSVTPNPDSCKGAETSGCLDVIGLDD